MKKSWEVVEAHPEMTKIQQQSAPICWNFIFISYHLAPEGRHVYSTLRATKPMEKLPETEFFLENSVSFLRQ